MSGYMNNHVPLDDDGVVGADLVWWCGDVLGDVYVHLDTAFQVFQELRGHTRHMMHLGNQR